MKRGLALFLALAAALTLLACAKPPEARWLFVPDRALWRDETYAGDGTLLAACDYELPRLSLVSADAEPDGEPPEELAAIRDAFNDAIERERGLLLEEYAQMEQLALSNYADRDAEARAAITVRGNRIEVAAFYQAERLVSVRGAGYAHWGGAHPWAFARVWNYDLATGAFFSWRDLTGEPDALRAALSERILEQIEERGIAAELYPDYRETVERLDGCEICFGEDGLTVIFDEQLLGPHAVGMPEFAVPYAAVAPYLNAYGESLLGLSGRGI